MKFIPTGGVVISPRTFRGAWYSMRIQTLESGGCSPWFNVFKHSVRFDKSQNAQFNLTNHRLATRWIVERWRAIERWRAVRKNPTPVIGQIKVRRQMRGDI